MGFRVCGELGSLGVLNINRELWVIGDAITNKVATLTLVNKGKR